MVSDIEEDQEEVDANESTENSKYDIIQKILDAAKCDLEGENLMDVEEPEEEGNYQKDNGSILHLHLCIIIMHLMFQFVRRNPVLLT